MPEHSDDAPDLPDLDALDGNTGEIGHLDCMSESLGACAGCGRDVSRRDKRERTKAGLFHAPCVPKKR